MVGEIGAVQAVSGVGGFSLFRFLSIGFLSLFLVLLLINTIYIAVEQRSIYPVISNLGNTFLLSTQHISELSNDIIEKGGGYERTEDFWTGIWRYICVYGKLFIALYTIYCWIWILMTLFAWSPFSDGSSHFKNLSLAIITFILLQSIILLGNAAVTKNVGCFNGCENSVIYYLATPVKWIWDFIRAVPLIIRPTGHITHTLVGNSTLV